MKKIVIFGPNDLGRLLKFYVDTTDEREVVAFTVDREFMNGDTFLDLPVIPFDQLADFYPPNEYEVLLAIGNKRMNDIRKEKFLACKEKGYTLASYIHPNCSFHCKKIGEGNIFLEKCMIYPFSEIGNGNLCWDHVLISHDCKVGDFNTFSSYADLCGYVTIGNNGYFGKHCILNDGMNVADYTLVGAAAYAKKDTKKYDVIVPARSIVLENKKSTDLM